MGTASDARSCSTSTRRTPPSTALVRVLQTQIAVTPRGDLPRAARGPPKETRDHAERLE